MRATAGMIAIRAGLPEDLHDFGVLDKAGIDNLLNRAAQLHPEKYVQIVQHLMRVGGRTAQLTGAHSYGLEHLRPTAAGKAVKHELQRKFIEIHRDKSLSDDEKEAQVIALLREAGGPLNKAIMQESLSEHNPLALQVAAGTRGNASNVRRLKDGDLLYVDHNSRPIPFPIFHSYSQGLTPAEYFAGTFGSRKGVVSTKMATAEAGFLCLAEGAQVRMADGSTRAIEDVLAGERVVGADRMGRTFPVRVTAVFDRGPKQCWRTTFREPGTKLNELEINSTLDHRMLAWGGASLKNARPRAPTHSEAQMPGIYPVGDPSKLFLALIARNEFFEYAERLNQEPIGPVGTWDIEVDHPDHLFVLANGLIVSNSKQLHQVSHRLVVAAKDADPGTQTNTPRGLPVSVDDAGNPGSFLAHETGGYPRNTLLSTAVLADLRSKGVERLLVRSPTVGGHPSGGVYAYDLGMRELGLPHVGQFAGVIAAQALSEGLTQGSLSEKHSAGVAGKALKVPVGFPRIDQNIQVPAIFKGGAAHAQIDGRVTAIRPAPQGGNYITVDQQDHYVGHGFDPRVKVGDLVEAGDVLSEGLPNPAEAVKYKHIGEGRRLFVDLMDKAYQDSGLTGHRRNLELLARGMIDHVELDDELGDNVPGDVVSYTQLEHNWRPRPGHHITTPAKAKDLYLEQPVLQYSIGTKIKPSVIKDLQHFGVQGVTVHPSPPPFQPVMVRGMDSISHDPDWMTRFLGSYVQKNFLESVHRGRVSDEDSTSYVPALARSVDFGKHAPIQERQEEPSPLVQPAQPARLSALNDAASLISPRASVKQAADEDVLGQFKKEYPAGTRRVLADDDEEDNGYPLREITYPVDYGPLLGHEHSDGAALQLLRGTDARGEHGSFKVFRPEAFNQETKFYANCSPFEKDQILRAYAPVLAAPPTAYKDYTELRKALAPYKTAES